MIEIKPNALYTRSDLAAMLEDTGVNVDTFIGRISPRKVFKMLYFGQDLLDALSEAPGLAEKKTPARSTRAGNRRVNSQKPKRTLGSPSDRAGARLRDEFKIAKGKRDARDSA